MHGVDDGLLLPHPVDPGDARQLPHADDDRREGPGVSADQPAELVHLHGRRGCSRCARCSPAASTPAGRSTRRYSTTLLEHQRHRWRRSASSSPASRRS